VHGDARVPEPVRICLRPALVMGDVELLLTLRIFWSMLFTSKLRDAPAGIGEIVMDICRTDASLVGRSYEDTAPVEFSLICARGVATGGYIGIYTPNKK